RRSSPALRDTSSSTRAGLAPVLCEDAARGRSARPGGARGGVAAGRRAPRGNDGRRRPPHGLRPRALARELLVLVEEPGAAPAVGHTGLYHFALLVPERADLARWLAHAIRDRVPLVG